MESVGFLKILTSVQFLSSSLFLTFFLDLRNTFIDNGSFDLTTFLNESATPWVLTIVSIISGGLLLYSKYNKIKHDKKINEIEIKMKLEELERKEIENENLKNKDK